MWQFHAVNGRLRVVVSQVVIIVLSYSSICIKFRLRTVRGAERAAPLCFLCNELTNLDFFFLFQSGSPLWGNFEYLSRRLLTR